MPILNGKCNSKARLDGKTAVITGCNTGIGKETVLDLYKRGARVIMACRDTSKAGTALEEIKEKCKNTEGLGSLLIAKLDLNSLSSVRECAKGIMATEPKINILINNAGVFVCPQKKTEDGFEIQLGTNHLSHFLFTMLLLPRIIKSAPARIINVSSKLHKFASMNLDDLNFEKRAYKPANGYAQSKLANVLFTKELANRLKARNIEGITVYSLHPGLIATEIFRHLDSAFFPGVRFVYKSIRLFIKSPKAGAQTTIYCAVDEKCAKETGLYYSDCVAIKPSRAARDMNAADKLWEVSCELVGIENWDPFTVEDKGCQ